MKTKLILSISLLTLSLQAQIKPGDIVNVTNIFTPPSTTNVQSFQLVPVNAPNSFQQNVTGIVGAIDESTNLFNTNEFELRLGGVYVQKTGQAGTVLAAEKWDLFTSGLGVGIETITSGQDQAAEFGYLGYRKTFGNVAGVIFAGGGYDELEKEPLGVIGVRVELRTTKHLGLFTSFSYGLEKNKTNPDGTTNKRGMIVGAGVVYAF